MRTAIGIDVGGSSIKLGVVEESGRILSRRRIQLPNAQDFLTFSGSIIAAVEELRADAREEVEAIGLAVPGFIDPESGLSIDGIDNVPALRSRSLPAELERSSGLKVVAQNDGVAAARGEMLFGAGRPFSRFVLMTIGTGIGGGLVIDGKLVTGNRGEPPELGAIVLDTTGPVNYSGMHGTLEAFASVPGLNSAYGSKDLPAEEIFRRAAAGDAQAERALEVVCTRLAQGCGILVNALNLEACIFGGGVSHAGEVLRARVERHLSSFTWPMLLGNCQVLLAEHRNDAGVLGAAALAAGWTRLQ